MAMDAGTLHRAIAEVCPISGTKVVDANDRGTWSYVPEGNATPQQLADADNVIQTIAMETLPPLLPAQLIARFEPSEYLVLEQKRDTAATVATAQLWDAVTSMTGISMDHPKVGELKDDLVANGVLSQERADEVFGTAPSAAERTWGG